MNKEKKEKVSPIYQEGLRAFKADLPELLKTHSRKWVAYHSAERIGFGPSMAELTQECIQQGVPYEELLVRMV